MLPKKPACLFTYAEYTTRRNVSVRAIPKHSKLILKDSNSPMVKKTTDAKRASHGAKLCEGIGLFFLAMASDSWSM